MTKELCKDFKNDVLFNYLLHDDLDSDSSFMLKLFIENIFNIKCEHVTVFEIALNLEQDMIYDVKVKTDNGDIIDFEMQNSAFSKEHYYHFYTYGSALLVSQVEEGKEYLETINPVYQIIFIDDIDEDNLKLIDTYRSADADGNIEKHNLITRSYVQLPYINNIKKEKGLKEMTEIELAIYILKNGIDDEVNALKNSKVVKIMKKKLEMFNEDEHLRDMYYKRGANEF